MASILASASLHSRANQVCNNCFLVIIVSTCNTGYSVNLIMFYLRKLSLLFSLLLCLLLWRVAMAENHSSPAWNNTLAQQTLAAQLGWRSEPDRRCGGSYFEAPFEVPESEDVIKATGNQALFSLHGTST